MEALYSTVLNAIQEALVQIDSILIGLAVALLAILIFELLVSPRLEVRRAKPDVEIYDFPPQNPSERFLKLEVVNRPLQVRFLPFLTRRIALGCRTHIEFIDSSTGQRVPSPPLPESAKWTIAPEGRYDIDPTTGKLSRFMDSSMFPQIEIIDIGPSTPQTLDLVVKQQGDADFYMHNALNLMHPTFQHPDNRLQGSNFHISVRVIAENGSSKPAHFVITNSGNNLQDLAISDVSTKSSKVAKSNAKWWKRVSFIPFIIAVLVTLGILIYGACIIPESSQYTPEKKLHYILTNIASILGMLVAFVGVKNKWFSIALIIAIQLFVVGIFFQLADIIKVAH